MASTRPRMPSGTNNDALKLTSLPLRSVNERYFQVVNSYLPYFPEATNAALCLYQHISESSNMQNIYLDVLNIFIIFLQIRMHLVI